MSNKETNKINNEFAYDELGIIIEQQAILQQKVSILIGINTGLLVILLSMWFAFSSNWYIFSFIIIYSLPPIFMNVYIMFPRFKSGDSKYFYNYANMEVEDIKSYLESNDNNVYVQIRQNSKITKDKYNIFKHALAWTFLLIPYLFTIEFKKK